VLQAGAPIDPQSGEIVPARLQEWLAGLSTYIAFCDGVVQKALSSSPHARRASPFGCCECASCRLSGCGDERAACPLPHLPVCVWRRVHRTLYRDLTLPQGATRLALMPPAMAGPISLYLSAVGRHRLLGERCSEIRRDPARFSECGEFQRCVGEAAE